ncbi:MAG: transglycosylase SLT domain-containing protein [Actinomycetes bacterium]
MIKSLRKPIVVMTAAFAITMLASVNTTFAEVNFAETVIIPDAPVATSIMVDPTISLSQNFGAINLGAGSSVDAGEMALVSLAARQVQLAKTPEGAKIVAAQLVATTYKWSAKQMSCLTTLWNGESHWNFKAHNYSSGATGIAQALPASKMNIIATDWRTNPVTQLKWGLRYIKIRYGTPCKALAKTRWSGYY